MSRGVVLIVHDNGVIEYHRMALVCAWFIKWHMDVQVCLMGDKGTLIRARDLPSSEYVFDDMIHLQPDPNKDRCYVSKDGEVKKEGMFLNKSRPSVYELSPFDETLLIDLDYLIMNDGLNQVWGSDAPIRINSIIDNIAFVDKPEERRLHQLSIPLYWATVIYFRKSPEAQAFFEGMEYIRNNYDHYGRLYRFTTHLYRNDYAASIMVHLLNGSTGENGIKWPVQTLPEPELMFAWDNQPLLKLDTTRAWFVGHYMNGPGRYVPGLIKDRSVHVMNKQSLIDVGTHWLKDQHGFGFGYV